MVLGKFLLSSLYLCVGVYAYITDIKLVSCNETYACANYPGYDKIPTNLNKGVKDGLSIYLHYKSDPNAPPITDLIIQQGSSPLNISHANSWKKINVDLNQKKKPNDASSLWLYYTTSKSISNNPVTSIVIKEGYSPLVSTEYRRIPVDLNKDVGGEPLFMYFAQDKPKLPVTSITAQQCFTSNCYIDGWERVEKDLNKGIVLGMNVYLFYKREKDQDPVTDVVVILNDQTPPQGYNKVDVNLNSVLRGDKIYLYYQTTPSNPDVLKESVQELAVEFGPDPITPYGWKKLNVNLNSDHNGKDGFGEPTFLFIKKGYKELPKMEPMHFDDSGRFKIVQLADLHFSNEKGICRDLPVDAECKGDKTTMEYVEKLLDREKPNLVVFSGDNINGEGVSDARAATFKFAEPVIKRKIPWAVAFGDHDDESDLSREELIEVIRKMPYSLTENGPSGLPGVGNYLIKIYDKDKQTHGFTLYFLDSHGYAETEDDVDNYYISPEQLDWIKESGSEFGKLPSKPKAAVFFHTPIWEYHIEEQRAAKLGDAREDVLSPAKNKTSAFEAFKLAGDIRVVSSGHDHLNDYCLEKEDIKLCYGGGAGVGGYGAEHLGWKRRARVYSIDDNGKTILTWKRLFTNKLPMIDFQTLY